MKSTKASMSSRGPPSLESVWRQFNLKRTTSVTRVNKKSENERLKISKFPGIFEALELFFCKPKLRILQFSKFPTFHEVPKVPNFYFIRLEFVQFLWHSFGATEAHLKPPCYLKKSSLHAYIKTNLSILVLFWRFDLAKNVIAISKWNLSRFRFANADGQCTANAGKSVDLANLFKSIVPQCSTPILDCDWFLPHNSMSYTILKKRLGNRLAKRCGPQTRVAAISIGNRLSKLQSKTPNIDAALQDHGSDSHTTWSTQAYCVQHLLIQGKPPQHKLPSIPTAWLVATRTLDEKDSKVIPSQKAKTVWQWITQDKRENFIANHTQRAKSPFDTNLPAKFSESR